ncbi:hypothetical protein, partial [Streptomyces sp. NPDC001978]|uniref:hypothetical protein n=1 Tax=Streptomyces sp. NPDC001978 TaxID=3364627 RepID=UPI0036882AA9
MRVRAGLFGVVRLLAIDTQIVEQVGQGEGDFFAEHARTGVAEVDVFAVLVPDAQDLVNCFGGRSPVAVLLCGVYRAVAELRRLVDPRVSRFWVVRFRRRPRLRGLLGFLRVLPGGG